MFADGLGIPIATAEARETGALGAAIGAGVGIGLFGTYEAGIAAMTRPRDTFMPDRAMRTHYDRRYALFGRTREVMRDIWADFRQQAGPR
jgi:L-xylulokinase